MHVCTHFDWYFCLIGSQVAQLTILFYKLKGFKVKLLETVNPQRRWHRFGVKINGHLEMGVVNIYGTTWYFAQFSSKRQTEGPPQLLDRLMELGDMARELSHQLGGNGHRPEQVAQLMEELAKR